MEQVIYDGVDLCEYFGVVGVRRPFATPTPRIEFVQGGSRNVVRGVDLVPPTISFRVVARELSPSDRREGELLLASLLVKEEPVRVQFSDDDGRYYIAVPDGPLEVQEFVQSGYVDVNMTCLEPAAYGAARKVDVEGSADLRVGGTYRTALKVTSEAAVRDSSSYLWGVRLDGGVRMLVELPTSGNSRVELDSAEGTAKVNGATSQITLASSWLVVEPGTHSIEIDAGSGGYAVEWTERWLG